MITLSILLILSIAVSCYLGYRAYYLAGAVSDAQEYIEEFLLEFQDRVMDIDDFLSDDELEDYFWKIDRLAP